MPWLFDWLMSAPDMLPSYPPTEPMLSSSGRFWLNGEVAGCRCPDCGGPMSIRLWLMIADCALCGAGVELTEAEERELQALIARAAPPPPPIKPAVVPAQPTTVQPRVAATAQAAPAIKPKPRPDNKKPVRQPAPPPVAATEKLIAPPLSTPVSGRTQSAKQVVNEEDEDNGNSSWLAMLASLIFHILLMMLLALFTLEYDKPRAKPIILTATWGEAEKPGDRKQPHQNDERSVRIQPGPEAAPQPKPEPPKPAIVEKPPQPKPEPKPEIHVPNFVPQELATAKLPAIETIQSELSSPESARMHVGRDPRIRTQMVEHEGGSTASEAAVANGLRWLSRHQSENGSWGLRAFNSTAECDRRCTHRGGAESTTAATGLALLPMLGAGQTPRIGIYKNNVERGLSWLIDQQRSDGDLRSGDGNMYAHGIASIALCEAYALTRDERFRDPAQRAIDFIVAAQAKDGGWRYQPREPGDLSVVGWQLMALQSGRSAGLDVPDNTLERIGGFLNRVQSGKSGGLYRYLPGRRPDEAMTAEGLLCRQYLGWEADHAGLKEGVRYLLNHPPNRREPHIYYWYYGTMVLHHLGGESWDIWNVMVRDALIEMQEDQGHAAGSWEPRGGMAGGHDTQMGGRIYMTALAICTLEVYYRHLPLYRRVELTSPNKSEQGAQK